MIKLKDLITEFVRPSKKDTEHWNEERSGWFDHEGYHITTSDDDKWFIAKTPDGKTIASHLRNFGLADNAVDAFKKKNPDY